MLLKVDVLALYKSANAYLEGHFLLASGRHAPAFLQSTRVLQYPNYADVIGRALASRFKKVDFVIGPAMGGVVLAHVVAKPLACRALFAEKDGKGGMLIREAFEIKPGERFIAVEDVITTGGSLKKAVQVAEAAGAVCAGAACIIDRRPEALRAEWKLEALEVLPLTSYPADDCPLCQQGIVLEEV